MKEMKKALKIGLFGLLAHIYASTALAATGTSAEFKIDLAGMGPWDVRTAAATEAICYSSTWATNTLDGAKAVVKVYPVKREKPKYIAIDLSGGTAATHYPIEYLDEIPGGSWSDEYKTSKLVLRHIPAGSFVMGERNTDYPAGSITKSDGTQFEFSGSVNTNLHLQSIGSDFYIGIFEITQRQWELVMGNRPSAFTNEGCYAKRPVERVSYVDIRGGVKGITWPKSKEVDEYSFMGKLRKKSGLTGFDLPSETQWEYACRAGTITALNSGKNISSWKNGNEMCEVSRNQFNSGWVEGAKWTDDWTIVSTDKGSAEVGSYSSNQFGLYDMHGNVWELCLDWMSNTQNVDKGGGWQSTFRITSGCRASLLKSGRSTSVGFRLCLHGGELPEVDNSVTIVNTTGSGAANWTPTKAGTYYLTHETQTNGVNGAEVLGAWFTVDAPKLTFEPDGDLVPGVKIAIGGAGEGWTVRYEVSSGENGGVGTRRPTMESPEYTGPITLNESATIRAVAFSDGGLESLEYSATFSLMSVGGAVAKPRYPWNGKVDIDVTVKGAENEDYLVSLVARDLDGGTNLPLRTAWQAGGTITNNAFLVKPGAHRFTWDVDADIQTDGEFPRVAVSVSATGSALVGYARQMTLTVDGYTGAETLTNVPVLVRLSTAIEGFCYGDFADASGGDLIFTDENGSTVYPHEIDEWHTNGESLVWVKLPLMANGTKFKAGYGGGCGATALPDGDGRTASPLAAAVWSDYAGVWHMNEDSGTAYDSTAHGLDALPSKGTNTLADTSQMVAYENGACGMARVNLTIVPTSDNRWMNSGTFMLIPSYDGLGLVDCFVASIWINGTVPRNYPRIFSRKNANEDEGGFELAINDEGTCDIRGGSSACTDRFALPPYSNDWVQIVLTMSGDVVNCYTNGTLSGTSSGVITASGDNGLCLGIGSKPNGNSVGYLGQYDEIRLRGGTLSADRIKADYDMIKNRDFLIYGPVKNGMEAAE